MTYQFEKASVLVVGDMRPMLALTASLLKIFGFKNVYTAVDADEAFAVMCVNNPDLVITDWLMEPQDGIDLCNHIRTDPKCPNPYVPIVLMTGYSARVRVEQARDVGITEFLVKPFTAKDLYTRIEQLIEKPRRFVDANEFFGPDRHRRKNDEFKGPFKRGGDKQTNTPQTANDERIQSILKRLRQETKDVTGTAE